MILGFFLAAFVPAIGAEEGNFDKTIPFLRGGAFKLDWAYQKCEIQSVTARDYPDRLEIEKARSEKPNAHSSITRKFLVDNRSSSKFEVKVLVEILDKSGQSSRQETTARVSALTRPISSASPPAS